MCQYKLFLAYKKQLHETVYEKLRNTRRNYSTDVRIIRLTTSSISRQN